MTVPILDRLGGQIGRHPHAYLGPAWAEPWLGAGGRDRRRAYDQRARHLTEALHVKPGGASLAALPAPTALPG
jgi:hypothetical protein